MTDDLDLLTSELMLAGGLLPNLQHLLLDRGVRFRSGFATHPLCAPSRATFLSGRYSHNHGVLRNNAPFGSVVAFNDMTTLATVLHTAGYRTGHIGKYINGYGYGGPGPLDPHYVPPGWDDWHALVEPTTYNVYNYATNDNGVLNIHGSALQDYQTSVIAGLAAQFVTGSLSTGKPLFLSVTPVNPHWASWGQPTSPPPADETYSLQWRSFIPPDPRQQAQKPGIWQYLANQMPLWPSWKPSFNQPDVSLLPLVMQRPLMTGTDIAWLNFGYRTRYLAMLSVDDLIGTIATAFGDQLGNVIFIFTSDNGFLNGEHRMSQKMVAYEESSRIPLYVGGAGVIGPRDVSAMVLNNDLMPTIRELAGLPADPSADGRSLVPYLQGLTPADWRKRVLIEHWGIGSYLVDVPTYAALRTGPTDAYPGRLFVEYHQNGDAVSDIELYDLAADPYQIHNLATDPSRAAEIYALHAQLTALEFCGPITGTSCQALER
jgi:arylsulfatase A-like enzyme